MTRDLSREHTLVGDLFRLPRTAAEWSACRISDEQVRFYHENGYLAGVRVLDDRQVEALPAELAALMDPSHEGHSLFSDDATQENGCLQYVPGSHTWDLLPKPALAGDMDAIRTVLTGEQNARFTPVAIELPRGYASFHHPLMLHGSPANASDRPRRVAVINVVRDGVESRTNEPLLAGVPAVPAGQPLGGRFFPLLFDPARVAARQSRIPGPESRL